MFVEMVQNPGSNGSFVINDNFLEEPRHDKQQPAGVGTALAQPAGGQQPYYLHNAHQPHHQPAPVQHNNFDHHEEVEESLNIMDMEKDLIIKALKKHRSKRKDAALDLGISERTLYRKLKEYDIEDL
jgi:DNA-binding NtrC family response regulator